MTLGSRVKERRIQLKLTQDELAKRMGYKSRSSIANIESDRSDLHMDIVQKLAGILNVKPSYLLGINDRADYPDANDVAEMILDPQVSSMVTMYLRLSDKHKNTIYEQVEYYYKSEGN